MVQKFPGIVRDKKCRPQTNRCLECLFGSGSGRVYLQRLSEHQIVVGTTKQRIAQTIIARFLFGTMLPSSRKSDYWWLNSFIIWTLYFLGRTFQRPATSLPIHSRDDPCSLVLFRDLASLCKAHGQGLHFPSSFIDVGQPIPQNHLICGTPRGKPTSTGFVEGVCFWGVK